MAFKVPNPLRVRKGAFGTDERHGNNGAFMIAHPNPASSLTFSVIASDGAGWEHVSVSLRARTPTWEEMCFIKGQFWDDEDLVVQLHPPRSEWVNNHPHCLHLWRSVTHLMPVPPGWMVGVKEMTPDDMAAMSSAERLALYDRMQP